MSRRCRCLISLLLILENCALGTGLSSKVGTGFGFNNVSDLVAMKGLQWWYNWGTSPNSDIEQYASHEGIEFVPMQWSKWGIEDLINSPYLSNASALLGYNEPNHREQANLEPREAASLWLYIEEAAKKFDLRLGTPSAAPCGAHCIRTNPFDWWDEFFFHCKSCTFDFLAVHIYSCNGDMFASFLEECKKYGLPVWVTEFACPIGPGPHLISQQYFMDAAVGYMDASKEVERYAWFAPRVEDGWVGESASLLHPDQPLLSQLGKQYLQSFRRSTSFRKGSFDGASWSEICKQCFNETLLSKCNVAITEKLCFHCKSCGFHAEHVLQRHDHHLESKIQMPF